MLAGGVLGGKYNGGLSRRRAMLQRFVNEKSQESTRRYQLIAEELGMSVVTLAIAWSKQHDFVASTIVGATPPDQVPELMAKADNAVAGDAGEDQRHVARSAVPDGPGAAGYD